MARQKHSGVYAIENTVNGKCYFGSTVDRDSRWQHHRRYLRTGRHQNRHLQRAWVLYGEAAFRFVWLQDVPPDQLLDAEQECLDAFGDGYNIARCAEAFMRGRKKGPNSAEHNRKIAEWNRGRKRSAETCQAISEAQKRNAAKISARLTGRKIPPEIVAKQAAKVRGRKLPPRSPEHSRKISEALKRHYHPELFVETLPT